MAGGVATGAEVPAVSDDYLLRRWDMEDGLPQNSVSDIVQTPDGYLWLGTRDGLVRFDGVRFKVCRSFDATNQFVPGVRCLATDAEGALWAGFERSAVVRERAGQFQVMSPPGNYSERVYALAADEAGDVWAGYTRASLGRWHAGQWTTLDLNPRNKALRLRENIFCCADRERRIWFTSEWMVGYLEAGVPVVLRENVQEFFHATPRRAGGVWLTGGRMLRIATTDGIGDQVADLNQLGVGFSGSIQTLLEDRQGAVWIGTKGNGLFRYFEGKVQRVPTSHNYIRALCEDREGNLWVGTDGGGLNRLRLRNLRLYDRNYLLSKDVIVSLCEATDGSLWLAPSEAAPIQLARDRQTVLPHTNQWELLSGVTLCADHSGGVWLGSYDRGVFHLRADGFETVGLKNKHVNSVLEDSHGTLWVGTLAEGLFSVRGGQITQYPDTNRLQLITALAEDAGGHLWVGTYSGVLLQRSNDTFEVQAEMPGVSILTVYPAGPDCLWIGTRGGGLWRLQDGKLRQVTHQQGLPDDDVRQILADNEGGLWIGSAHGLFRVSQREVEAVMNGTAPRFEAILYDRNEGLGIIEFSEGFRNAACRTADGKLWFATSRGAVEVTPERRSFRLLPPLVHLEEFLVDGQPVPLDFKQPVMVPAGSRSVELRYTGLSFASPENIRFRHRLEDVESDWLDAGSERTATYLRLQPGKYRFSVTARSSGGAWQPAGTTVSFVVLPTLWQNLYFRTFLVLLLLALAAGATRALLLRRMRARMRALEQAQVLNNERRRIARDMHDELGASLTRIELMGHQASRNPRLDAETSLQVRRISSVAREVVQTLDQIVWTVNPGNDRLDRVIGYLSHYAAEFLAPTKIIFKQELPETVAPTSMASHIRHELLLAVKEALNNAVKHSGATEITLQVALENNLLTLMLTDNGRGFDPAATANAGDGLGNLSQRLASIGGACQTESAVGKGSVVRMTLPLSNFNPI